MWASAVCAVAPGGKHSADVCGDFDGSSRPTRLHRVGPLFPVSTELPNFPSEASWLRNTSMLDCSGAGWRAVRVAVQTLRNCGRRTLSGFCWRVRPSAFLTRVERGSSNSAHRTTPTIVRKRQIPIDVRTAMPYAPSMFIKQGHGNERPGMLRIQNVGPVLARG